VKFDDKFNNLTEAYLKIPGRRLMYPRGLQLSEEFRNAYRAEVIRLAEAGQNPGKLCEKVNKALMIHYSDHNEQLNEIATKLATETPAVAVPIAQMAGRAVAGQVGKHLVKKGASKGVQKVATQAADDLTQHAVHKGAEKLSQPREEGYGKKKIKEAGTAPYSPAPEGSAQRRNRQKRETKEKDNKAAGRKQTRHAKDLDKWSKDQS
jgi:hypothetical protein